MSGARQLRSAEGDLMQFSRVVVPEVAQLRALKQKARKAFLIMFEAWRDA